MAGEQTGRFHETDIADARTRHLVEEWRELVTLLPASVEAGWGVPTHARQLSRFTTPAETRPAYDDPTIYIHAIYARLKAADGLDRVRTEQRSADLLQEVFDSQVAKIRRWWQDGYQPRVGTIRLDGDEYDIYNHQPAFAFTGNVTETVRFNWHTKSYEPWLAAEFDTTPLRDDSGDFIPSHPDAPVIILPSMSRERHVDRALAAAHIIALHDSLSPAVVAAFAGRLPDVVAEEKAALAEVEPRKRGLILAQAALAHLF